MNVGCTLAIEASFIAFGLHDFEHDFEAEWHALKAHECCKEGVSK